MPCTIEKFAARIAALHNGEVFTVGGTVRDELLRIKPKDIDLVVTGVAFCSIEAVLKSLNVKHDLVGKSFGVIKAKMNGEIDIALPRKEISTGPGHKDFSVIADPNVSIEEDALRRDFTFNAMYKNVLTGELIDPLNGSADLKMRILRVTSPKAFAEDPLRILRAVQFCARFDLRVDSGMTMTTMVENAPKLKHISPERVALELEKLLVKSSHPSVGLKIMASSGVLKEVLPEVAALCNIEQPAKFHNADAFDHTCRVVDAVRPELNMRFSALFHDLGKKTTREINKGRITFHGHESESARLSEIVIDRLKLFSLENFDRETVVSLVKNHMFSSNDKVNKPAIRRLIRKVGGVDRFQDLMQLRIADKIGGAHPETIFVHLEFMRRALDIARETPALAVTDLAINGRDVMELLNISPGPRVGVILRALFVLVENDELPNEKAPLLAYVKKFQEDIS